MVREIEQIGAETEVGSFTELEPPQDLRVPAAETIGPQRPQAVRKYARLKDPRLECRTAFEAGEPRGDCAGASVSNAGVKPQVNVLVVGIIVLENVRDLIHVAVEE